MLLPNLQLCATWAISHKQIVITNNSYANISGSGAVNGYKFPDSIEVAYDYTGFFSAEFQILRWSANGTELKDVIAFAYMRIIVNDRMRPYNCVFPDFNIGCQ